MFMARIQNAYTRDHRVDCERYEISKLQAYALFWREKKIIYNIIYNINIVIERMCVLKINFQNYCS